MKLNLMIITLKIQQLFYQYDQDKNEFKDNLIKPIEKNDEK